MMMNNKSIVVSDEIPVGGNGIRIEFIALTNVDIIMRTAWISDKKDGE